MKQICCDLCGKILNKKGGIRTLELNRIDNSDFENYPKDHSFSNLHSYDICLKCFLKIEREINRLKKCVTSGENDQ